MIEAMGGRCQICSYNKCHEALEFHHLDPSKKEFSVSQLRTCPQKISVVITELKKCILVCACCHREIHAGITKVPATFAEIDESKLISEFEIKRRIRAPKKAPLDRRKILLTKEDFQDLLNTKFNGNKSALARYLKVSETAIRKYLKQNCIVV